MLLTSNPASKVEVATYLATDPNPGEQSVKGKSLSTVFGIPIHLRGKLSIFAISEILYVVS